MDLRITGTGGVINIDDFLSQNREGSADFLYRKGGWGRGTSEEINVASAKPGARTSATTAMRRAHVRGHGGRGCGSVAARAVGRRDRAYSGTARCVLDGRAAAGEGRF